MYSTDKNYFNSYPVKHVQILCCHNYAYGYKINAMINSYVTQCVTSLV